MPYAYQMKKRLFGFAAMILMLGACLLPVTKAAHAEESNPLRLDFGDDGLFTVLILSDLQDTQFTTGLVVSGETHVLADYPADLIVLLGDQLEGPSPVLRIGDGEKNCEDTLRTLLAPIKENGTPFVVVFGNHDYEAPMSIAKQVAIYESYDNCLAVSYGKHSSKDGAFVLPVYPTGSKFPAMALYFFDSGSYLPNGDYDTVSKEQVAWYNEQSAEFRNVIGNQPLPSIGFCHMPVPEVYELLTEVPEGTKGALKGVGVGKGKFYLPDETKLFTGDVNESPCPSSENYGLFDSYLANGDVFLTVNGHDHINSFIGTVKGVDIASVPGSSYTSYGQEDIRGVRLFRFTEFNVKDYETLHVLYSDYNTPQSWGPVRYFFSATSTMPFYNAIKVVAAIVLLVAAIVTTCIVLIVKAKKRKQHPAVLTPSGEVDEAQSEEAKKKDE